MHVSVVETTDLEWEQCPEIEVTLEAARTETALSAGWRTKLHSLSSMQKACEAKMSLTKHTGQQRVVPTPKLEGMIRKLNIPYIITWNPK